MQMKSTKKHRLIVSGVIKTLRLLQYFRSNFKSKNNRRKTVASMSH